MTDEISREDRLAVAAALKKRQAGDEPTADEKAALKRYRKSEEERHRWQHYRSIPKKHYRELSGRSAKVLLDQARRYGIPLAGRTLDLAKILTAFHDLLAANKHILAGQNEDPLLAGASQSLRDAYTRQQIREKDAKATLAELEVAERRGQLVDREAFRATMGPFFGILRDADHRLQREFGPRAHEIYIEALDEATERALETLEEMAGRDDAGDTG